MRLLAGPLLPPVDALDAAFFFSVLAFSSSSSWFWLTLAVPIALGGTLLTTMLQDPPGETLLPAYARSADCSLFTLLCKIHDKL
jgi:hypothetical protein